ncbi:MAG: molybdopterin-dependent oxidoreductase, partial [Candidatus Binataceae bacterium]
LNYRFIGDDERLRAPLVAGEGGAAETAWDTALEHAATLLGDFRKRHGGKAFGALVSPHLTNEENFRFGQMLTAFGAGRVAMTVRKGKADHLLMKAEKAANARGVRQLGLVEGPGDGLEELLRAVEAGEIKGLYICGDDIVDTVASGRLGAILGRLELLITQDLQARPEFARAAVVFPATTWAEKDGTFTNHDGRVQRIQRALETPPGWHSDGEIFTALFNRLESKNERFDPAAIWQVLGGERSPFAGIEYDQIGALGALPMRAGEGTSGS